jgi:hypothetical protein
LFEKDRKEERKKERKKERERIRAQFVHFAVPSIVCRCQPVKRERALAPK